MLDVPGKRTQIFYLRKSGYLNYWIKYVMNSFRTVLSVLFAKTLHKNIGKLNKILMKMFW